jgi:hypothetical protein
MGYQHRELAGGRWDRLSFFEQMANIGSEVERALELLDLTIDKDKDKNHLRELLRLREALVDYFAFENNYGSSDEKWHNYFYAFSFAARIDR